MSKEGTYIRYSCDRPAKAHTDGKEAHEYIKEGSAKENNWFEVSYTNSDQVTFKYCLCKECYDKYLDMKKKMDQQLASFMTGATEGSN